MQQNRLNIGLFYSLLSHLLLLKAVKYIILYAFLLAMVILLYLKKMEHIGSSSKKTFNNIFNLFLSFYSEHFGSEKNPVRGKYWFKIQAFKVFLKQTTGIKVFSQI